jgi:hypothetical protein
VPAASICRWETTPKQCVRSAQVTCRRSRRSVAITTPFIWMKRRPKRRASNSALCTARWSARCSAPSLPHPSPTAFTCRRFVATAYFLAHWSHSDATTFVFADVQLSSACVFERVRSSSSRGDSRRPAKGDVQHDRLQRERRGGDRRHRQSAGPFSCEPERRRQMMIMTFKSK